MLEIKKLRKSFGGQEILKGIDLTVEKGDVVAIIGPSGAGKTTLLRCVNSQETAGIGEMTFDGVSYDLGRMIRQDILVLRQKSGFVFRSGSLFRNKTALQNIAAGLITARKIPL